MVNPGGEETRYRFEYGPTSLTVQVLRIARIQRRNHKRRRTVEVEEVIEGLNPKPPITTECRVQQSQQDGRQTDCLKTPPDPTPSGETGRRTPPIAYLQERERLFQYQLERERRQDGETRDRENGPASGSKMFRRRKRFSTRRHLFEYAGTARNHDSPDFAGVRPHPINI